MSESPVGSDFDESSNIATNFSAKVSLDLVIVVKDFAELSDLSFAEILDSLSGIKSRFFDNSDGVVLSDPIDQRQRIKDRFFSW